MGNYIVKLEGKYLMWSSISDAPEPIFGLDLDRFKRWYAKEYGEREVRMGELDRRLARVEEKGTSAMDSGCALETIWLNRAGPKGEPLHYEEIVEFFVRRLEEPTEESLSEFRNGLPTCGLKCPAIPDDRGCANHCKRCWGTGHVREIKDPKLFLSQKDRAWVQIVEER